MNTEQREKLIGQFKAKSGREAFRSKTKIEELPFEYKYGSSSHRPDQKVSFETADMVLWVKFLDGPWFRPYGGFGIGQINKMIEICHNDNQVVSLFELLSAQKSNEYL